MDPVAICLHAIQRNDVSLKRVLLFPLQNRGPKEDGVRDAKVNSMKGEPGDDSGGARFLPSPLLYGRHENGKIVRQEQLGVPLGFVESSSGLSKSLRAPELL
jgi:hypothetical protein